MMHGHPVLSSAMMLAFHSLPALAYPAEVFLRATVAPPFSAEL
jgi:hypothetical protein